MELKNKTILIISQQDWGDMFISKHHYAAELARLGNTVYFVHGPDQKKVLKPGKIKIVPTRFQNIFILEHRFFYPYVFKFHAQGLHEILVRIHIKNVLKKLGRKADIIWSFDLSNTIPLKCFPANCVRIFMPVDEPLSKVAIDAAQGADVIFSVTHEILEKYDAHKIPKHFINHGVGEVFLNDDIAEQNNQPIHIGLSGNMLRPDIDQQTILKIVQANSDVIFDFWGTTNPVTSNLVSVESIADYSISFIEQLSKLPNVVLHGQLSSVQLAAALKKADGFLICYDIKKDQSKGTNYHKILEYLATGKVVVSNNVTTYQKYPGLIEMVNSRENNDELPELFSKVINNIKAYNAIEWQQKRVDFAKRFTYQQQIATIEKLLQNSYCKTNRGRSFENIIYNHA